MALWQKCPSFFLFGQGKEPLSVAQNHEEWNLHQHLFDNIKYLPKKRGGGGDRDIEQTSRPTGNWFVLS